MSVHNGIQLLLHVLKGFSILYERFGYFTPSAKSIFFNKKNEAKIWLNEDLRVTSNRQNKNNSKSLMMENNFLRETVKIFDTLRDFSNPMFCYSKCLPN